MEQWKNAVACQIQQCITWQQLEHLWNAIIHDQIKHKLQYEHTVLAFIRKIWNRQVQAVAVNFQKPITAQ
jgi:hypothetical protein